MEDGIQWKRKANMVNGIDKYKLEKWVRYRPVIINMLTVLLVMDDGS